jgi:hypothetical protein
MLKKNSKQCIPEDLSLFSGKTKMATGIAVHRKCRNFSQLFKYILKIFVASKLKELCSI